MNNEAITKTRVSAGVVRRPSWWTIRASGADRERFLNGMLSCDVAKIPANGFLYAVKPTNKGKVQGILRVRRSESAFHLDMEEAVAETVAVELMKLIVADDVELADETDDRAVLTVVGPQARQTVERAGYSGLSGLANGSSMTLHSVNIVRDDALGMPAYEVHVPPDTADATYAAFVDAGAAALSGDDYNVLRIEAGVVLDGVDVDDDTIALEARLEPIINFEKGCYVGQETIARAHNLGGVQYLLVGLKIESPLAPSDLWHDGKKVGELTSSAHSPTLEQAIALGYVRKAHVEPGTEVRVGAEDGPVATVAALPFVPTLSA